jgi:hypothetical protein
MSKSRSPTNVFKPRSDDDRTFELGSQLIDEVQEVCVLLTEPGSFECFTRRRQATRECTTLEELNNEVDRPIAELEELRERGLKILSGDNLDEMS